MARYTATQRLREVLVFVCMALLLLLMMQMSANCVIRAQLDIIAITPTTDSDAAGPAQTVLGKAGTEIPTGELLPVGTPAMLWGAVPSSAVITTCELIVNTGQRSFTANVSNDWGGSEYLTLQLLATGGCLAASDASGTQFAFVDNYGRYSALICPPSDAGSVGCPIYISGDDIDTIYNSYWDGNSSSSSQVLQLPMGAASRSRALSGGNKLDATITGRVTGVMTAANCTELGPLEPFCVPGELGFHRSGCTCGGGNCCNCFPGDALVRTRGGTAIPMSQLQLGDQVAVWGRDGVVTYDAVYAFGHKDAEAVSSFIMITVEPTWLAFDGSGSHDDHLHLTNSTSTIRLSDGHFIPTNSKSSAGSKAHVLYKRAKDIQVGDTIWATYKSRHYGAHLSNRLLPSRVKAISTTWGNGLYNPLTLSGTIIVDDVVASVHSEWFLDSVFDALGFTQWLPIAYQHALAPIRGLYQMMGNKSYIILYDKIDTYLNIPEFGTKYGGPIALGTACAIFAPFIMGLVIRAQKP